MPVSAGKGGTDGILGPADMKDLTGTEVLADTAALADMVDPAGMAALADTRALVGMVDTPALVGMVASVDTAVWAVLDPVSYLSASL